MTSVSDNRAPKQVRSEERRELILRAAWSIVLREGLRGVKHRAVAKEAGVPLASTTYYFSDIQSLIVQSFQLAADESYLRFTQPFWQQAQAQLDATPCQTPRSTIEDLLVNMAADFIAQRLANHQDHIVLEYAFLNAALHDAELQAAVRESARRWMSLLMPCLARVQIQHPEQAARCLLATVRRVEYESLIGGSQTIQADWIRQAIAYQVRGLW